MNEITDMKTMMLAMFVAFMNGQDGPAEGDTVKIAELPPESEAILKYMPGNVVIAHRGTTYWAPEETEAAMRWARNMGADYLELDLQRTRDGVLVAMYDVDLRRTTDVEKIFPGRAGQPVSDFTLEELRRLDAGTWFNEVYPALARPGFAGLDILTLEDVVQIAEGNRIVRDGEGRRMYEESGNGSLVTRYEPDPADNGNRPGIYPETKEPHLFPGMEADLRRELERLGWYHVDDGAMKRIPVKEGLVGIANTSARVILQTFSDESLARLKKEFKRPIPTCFLLWLGNDPSDIKQDDAESYAAKINYAVEQGAVIMGPSIAGAPNHYADLLKPWQARMIHRAGMLIHPYSFDTEEQMVEYTDPWRADGMFTNRADLTIQFYKSLGNLPDNIQREKKSWVAGGMLQTLGYKKAGS